jgi:hypothetical protein
VAAQLVASRVVLSSTELVICVFISYGVFDSMEFAVVAKLRCPGGLFKSSHVTSIILSVCSRNR